MNDNMFDVIPRGEAIKSLEQVFNAIRADTEDGPYSIPDLLPEMERVINAIPSVEAEPVRHGRWIYLGFHKRYCSQCYYVAKKSHFYCPRCGAKMYGGVSSR